jgi:glutathione S-transferase
MAIVLYTFWRSQAAFRVRIALRLKPLQAQMVFVDLIKSEQLAESYRALNPAMLLPALIDEDGPPIIQSLAILEYLEEQYPRPPLLPSEPRARAFVRAVAHMVAIEPTPSSSLASGVTSNRSYALTRPEGPSGFSTGSTPQRTQLKTCSQRTSAPGGSVTAMSLRWQIFASSLM